MIMKGCPSPAETALDRPRDIQREHACRHDRLKASRAGRNQTVPWPVELCAGGFGAARPARTNRTAGMGAPGPARPETAASGSASHAPAVGAAAQSSPSVNPGGVMIGAGSAKDTALCRAVPKLTRMTFMLSPRPPSLHVRQVLPAGATIRDRATVRQLATLLCSMPAVRPGQMACPNDMGLSYRLYFAAGARGFDEVTIALTGCRMVTGLGPPRSWSTSTALGQALSQHFGIHSPLEP